MTLLSVVCISFVAGVICTLALVTIPMLIATQDRHQRIDPDLVKFPCGGTGVHQGEAPSLTRRMRP